MSTVLRKIALVGGSGNLGPHILKALLAEPAFEVTVITRHNSSSTFPENTRTIKVTDGYPDEEMVEAFKDQDAVVLCLNHAVGHRQSALASASVRAGVKRLIASDYGGTNINKEAIRVFPTAARKAKAIDELQNMETPGWSWTAICCGLFADFCIKTGFLGLDAVTHTARIWDSGEDKFSATNLATVGLAVARVLAKPDETANRRVHISSFEWSLNELLAAYKKATGVSEWKVTYVDTDTELESGAEDLRAGNFRGMFNLALGSKIKRGLGGDFAEDGLLENDLLGLPRENVEETVDRVLNHGL